MQNEYLKFNGYYAVVDDFNNVYFESAEDGSLWLTKEVEVFRDWDIPDEILFQPVTINL